MVELTLDFDEFLGSLIARGVEFLVVGAYALAYHGAPRYTGDIDVFIKPTAESASRMLQLLSGFGFPPTNFSPQQVIEPTPIIQIGVEPVQIRLMSAISRVTWDEAWAGHETPRCGSHNLPFIGRAEFLRNKRAAGRFKHLADVEALKG